MSKMDFEKELLEVKQKITPIKTAKFLVGTVISCGAMAAVVAALKLPMQNTKGLTKLMMRLGIFVLGCKAGDMAEEYFSQTVDKMIDTWNEAKEEAIKNESDSDKQ